MSDEQAPDWVTVAGVRLRVDDGQVIVPPIAGAEEPDGEVQDTPTQDDSTRDMTTAEQADQVVADTEPAPTDEGATEGDVDWQKRYSDLQPEYTRATQRVKDLEPLEQWKPFVDAFNNPQSQREAVNWLLEQAGYELDGDTAEDRLDDDDDDVFHDPRVDQLLERDRQREFQENLSQLSGHVDTLLKDADVDLTDRQRNALMHECVQAGFTPQATERVVQAWADDVRGYRDSIIKNYVDGKRKQPPPAVKAGASGTEHVPLDSEDDRMSAALQVANEAFNSGS